MSCFIFCYAECHFVERSYAECYYAEYHYAECRYAGCHYAGCHYAECLGALKYCTHPHTPINMHKYVVCIMGISQRCMFLTLPIQLCVCLKDSNPLLTSSYQLIFDNGNIIYLSRKQATFPYKCSLP